MTTVTHLRWKLEVPDPQEEALCAWLEAEGSSAFYREADPPRACFAYFPPDLVPPESAGLAAFPGVRLVEVEAFGDEDWLAKSREGFGPSRWAPGSTCGPSGTRPRVPRTASTWW